MSSGVSSWYRTSQQSHCAAALPVMFLQQHEAWSSAPVIRQSYRAVTWPVVAARSSTQSTYTVARFISVIIGSGRLAGQKRESSSGLDLFGRTARRSVRAKDAAIARFGLQECVAVSALVEKHATIRRHGLFLGLTALRTRDGRLQHHIFRGHGNSSVRADGYPALVSSGVSP